MARAKTEAFAPDLTEVAAVAKALSHPGRLRILQILADSRSCICGDIVDRLPLSQSTVSQHLRELRRAGLIRGEIEGPRTCYCLDERRVAQAFDQLKNLFRGFGCCRPGTEDRGEDHECC